jgi:hypothetical protein
MGFSREGSFTCHTYCETGPRFIRSHLKDWNPRPTVGFEPATQGLSDPLRHAGDFKKVERSKHSLQIEQEVYNILFTTLFNVSSKSLQH